MTHTAAEIQTYIQEHCHTCTNFRGWDYERIMEYGEFKPTDKVLGTGAMHTYFCVYIAQFVAKVYATDSFAWAKRDYMHEQNLPSGDEWMRIVENASEGKVVGQPADVTNLDYPDGTFGKVLSISTIEHIDDDMRAMHEMMRVLKPGGLLLLTTELGLKYKRYSERDGSYYRIYDISYLLALIEGYSREELISSPHIYTEDTEGLQFTTVFIKIRKVQ